MHNVGTAERDHALALLTVEDEDAVSRSPARLLISAATPDGVETLARRIHRGGPRAQFPFTQKSAGDFPAGPETLSECCVRFLDAAAGGRLTIDEAAQHLKDKINSLVSQRRLQLVLNLGRVPYIDSGDLGQLVASYGSVKRAGGVVKLLNVNSRNHDLLSITRLVTLFESFDSEAEAVQSFDTLAPSAAAQ